MHSDFSFSQACWRGRFSQKLSRFPTRNACADAENKWFALTGRAKKLNVTDPPIITVIGKAYFDVGHAPKDQSNRRKYLPGYAAWEIHPCRENRVEPRSLAIPSASTVHREVKTITHWAPFDCADRDCIAVLAGCGESHGAFHLLGHRHYSAGGMDGARD